jgi:hypothetical protein
VTQEEPTRSYLEIDGVSFRLWEDGDVEVDLNSNDTWAGHYFKPEDARKLRDWLNKVLA